MGHLSFDDHHRRADAIAEYRTVPAAARALGLSVAALRSWAKRSGHTISLKDRHARAVAALRAHKTVAEAARALGLTSAALYARLAKHPELRADIGAGVSR